MRLGVLFSGGKDSVLALARASAHEEVVCLISVFSKNPESFMFHTPNIGLTVLQAKALGLPLVQKFTAGLKEKELADLTDAIKCAIKKYKIEGVVSGAIESIYQASRIQRICDSLGIWCFNPLWQNDQECLLKELLKQKYKVIISGVFAYPLTRDLVGKQLNRALVKKLLQLQAAYKISPAGEGGELETTVLDCPLFKKRIEILDAEIVGKEHSWMYRIRKAKLLPK